VGVTWGFVMGRPAAAARHLTPSASRRGSEVSSGGGGAWVGEVVEFKKEKVKVKSEDQKTISWVGG